MDKNYIVEIEDKEKELGNDVNNIKEQLEYTKKALIQNYEDKMDRLQKELELRAKVQIHELEERMN